MLSTEHGLISPHYCLHIILRLEFPDVVIQINFVTIMIRMYIILNANFLQNSYFLIKLRHDSALATVSLKATNT
jgi:hypothetical protein